MSDQIEKKEDSKPVEKTYPEAAYNNVKDDMLKYKHELKDAMSEIKKMRDEQEQAARKAKELNNEYKELYEEQLKANEALKNTINEKNNNFLNAQKLSRVKEKLGGFKKQEYNKFIDTSRVIIDNEGNVDETTVDNEVARLKTEYPELIKVKASSELPNEAPESGHFNPKQVQELTKAERSEIRRKAIEDRQNQ